MKTSEAGGALCALALLVAAPSGWAGVGQGDFEAGVSVSVTKTTIELDGQPATDSESGVISGSIGYFITDMIEGKAAASAIVTDAGTFGIFTPGIDFVFLGKKGTVAPFVGGSYGVSFGDTLGVDTDYFEGHGGVKFFIRERASLEVKLVRYEPTESAASARTELAAGLNIYF